MENENIIQVIEDINNLFDSGETAYSIAKATGITTTTVRKYMLDREAMKNMRVDFADKLACYWNNKNM